MFVHFVYCDMSELKLWLQIQTPRWCWWLPPIITKLPLELHYSNYVCKVFWLFFLFHLMGGIGPQVFCHLRFLIHNAYTTIGMCSSVHTMLRLHICSVSYRCSSVLMTTHVVSLSSQCTDVRKRQITVSYKYRYMCCNYIVLFVQLSHDMTNKWLSLVWVLLLAQH